VGRHSRKRNAPPEPPAAAAPPRRPEPGAASGDGPEPVAYAAQTGRPRAVPRPYPGERAPAGPGAGHGSAVPGRYVSTPPHGTPGVRGGHPQHREPGGAWGDPPTGPNRLITEPRGGGPGPSRRYGPRQEYLDAFDDTSATSDTSDDVFAAGATGRGTPPHGVPRTRGRSVQQVAGPPRAGDVSAPAAPPGEGAEPPGTGPPGPEPRPAKPKGRTFTGVAAAAVTTVLAVVVAGQVTGLEQRKENRAAAADNGAPHGGGADSSRSVPRATPSESTAARPATFAERIGRVQPLDPDLKGPGEFRTVGGHRKGTGSGEVVRYRVEVEKELPLDAELFAEAVHRTLNDDRSWAHDGARSFERVDSDEADFVITLASPGTTGVWCAKSGLDTTVQNVSCDSAATDRIMINAWRWAQGSQTFGEDRIRAYREMLINHEVGHRLGLGHRYCASDGAPAPVMMQQTKTLTTDGATCRPNPWPHP
jgi:hypothetical protein